MSPPKDAWVTEDLAAQLSQGDILNLLPFSTLIVPVIPLVPLTASKGRQGWEQRSFEQQSGKEYQFISKGKYLPAIILSHDCELDKARGRVLVAPIALLNTLSKEQHEKILLQEHFALMPVPDVPTLGICYVDLRSIASVDSKIVSGCARLASMTVQGKNRLQAQLVGFFTRLALPSA